MKTRLKTAYLAASIASFVLLVIVAVKLPYGDLSPRERQVLIPVVAVWTLATAWAFWKGSGPRSGKIPPAVVLILSFLWLDPPPLQAAPVQVDTVVSPIVRAGPGPVATGRNVNLADAVDPSPLISGPPTVHAYVGATSFLTDAKGNQLVDCNGNRLAFVNNRVVALDGNGNVVPMLIQVCVAARIVVVVVIVAVGVYVIYRLVTCTNKMWTSNRFDLYTNLIGENLRIAPRAQLGTVFATNPMAAEDIFDFAWINTNHPCYDASNRMFGWGFSGNLGRVTPALGSWDFCRVTGFCNESGCLQQFWLVDTNAGSSRFLGQDYQVWNAIGAAYSTSAPAITLPGWNAAFFQGVTTNAP